jgi:hypothetical protein
VLKYWPDLPMCSAGTRGLKAPLQFALVVIQFVEVNGEALLHRVFIEPNCVLGRRLAVSTRSRYLAFDLDCGTNSLPRGTGWQPGQSRIVSNDASESGTNNSLK